MKIVKTTTKTYDVTFYPNAIDWTFKSFIDIREKHNLSTKMFEKCFCCGYKFVEEDKPIFITVSSKGNLFGCDKCYKESKGE